MNKKELWLWIALIPEINNKKIELLINSLGSIEEIYSAGFEKINSIEGISDKEAKLLVDSRRRFDVEKQKAILEEKEIQFVCTDDKEYPDKLRIYRDSPYYIFYKGNLPKDFIPSVAMVGARACSNYGRNMAKSIGKELSLNGVQIISGMARGIDTYSQLGAIEGGTQTFAVLGCGVDICYPVENIELYQAIIDNGGGIISEYSPGTSPLAWHFPMRNRIISALSDKIAVIEAKEKSGSLITVEWALEQGKDIFVVPGRVNDVLSAGCNRLLKAGAGILTEAFDILSELNYDTESLVKIKSLNEKCLEKDLLLVYSELGLYPKSVHTLIEETRLKYEELMEILLKLQLLGLVDETYKNYYARTNVT